MEVVYRGIPWSFPLQLEEYPGISPPSYFFFWEVGREGSGIGEYPGIPLFEGGGVECLIKIEY